MTTESTPPTVRPYKRHIIVCAGPRCSPCLGEGLYERLKERLKELRLHEGSDRVQRTKTTCLGVCREGPIAVVYPEGTWYCGLTEGKLERIIQEHLVSGRAISEYAIHTFQSKAS